MQIDFVVPWVDGNDPIWRKKKEAYIPSSDQDKMDIGEERYRDWGIFKYWFRSVEKNAPWVRYIYLITDNQIPSFLKTDHPKLRIIFHEDYIPRQYLPTFSSHVIELNMHRLPGLSEYFIYFNDDIFLNKPVNPSFFFRKNKPCYTFRERPLVLNYPLSFGVHITINNMALINNFFNRKSIIRHPELYFNFRYGRHSFGNLCMLPFPYYFHFLDDHMACPMLRPTLEDVWNKAGDVLDTTCNHRIRTNDDVNQYVFRYWDLARGNFSPHYAPSGYYNYGSDEEIKESVKDIAVGVHTQICINDSYRIKDFEALRQEISTAFAQRYPTKCSFEI